MAIQLEGITRNVGKHAGGVVIAPSRLTDFSPLFCDESGGGLVTQYDKGDVEDAGLVKFDFLGLRTLTIIDWAVKMINSVREQQGELPLDIMQIPLDDGPTFELLQVCGNHGGVPAGIAGHEGADQAPATRSLRGYYRPGGLVSAWAIAIGHGGQLYQPQAWS